MEALAQLLGVDAQDPEYLRAQFLAKEDHQLLRKLVALRKRLNLSQGDVAERLGLTQPTIAAFERYDSDPKLSTIRRYAQVVGLLVGHRVEIDHGQGVTVTSGCWAGGWQPVSFSPNSSVSDSMGSSQKTVSADSNRAAFALVA